MNILQISTSLFAGIGQSTRLADQLVASLREQHPAAEVTVRDLAADPVPHLDASRFAAFSAKERSAEQQAVLAARGGLYAGTAADTQTPYVRDFLAFLGITDVEFVYAEGLAISAESRDRALAAAQGSVRLLAARTRLAA